MDIITLALANNKSEGGSSIDISTSIATDKDSNTKAASPKAVNDFVEGKGYLTEHQSLADYAKTADVNTALSAKADTATVNAALALKANTADVTAQIAAAIGSVSSFEYYLCGEGEYDAQTGVPTVQDPDTEHIYLVPTSGTNLNMYAYIGSAFTFLGTTEVDLSGYVQESDLADVATSGSYLDLDDTPDIPTKTSDLINDSGFITSGTMLWQGGAESSTQYPSEIPGYDYLYIDIQDFDASDLEKIASILQWSGSPLCFGDDNLPLDLNGEYDEGIYFGVNCDWVDDNLVIIDNTKPFYIVNIFENQSSELKIQYLSSEPVEDTDWKIFSAGASYVTEDELEDYAKKTDLTEYTKTTGFHQVAFSGNYNHLSNRPTIPTVPAISTNITSDAGSDAKTVSPKAVKTFVEGKGYLTQHQSLSNVNAARVSGYKITVETEAPDAGTPDTTITIVVPE